jgi:hypothetical protein
VGQLLKLKQAMGRTTMVFVDERDKRELANLGDDDSDDDVASVSDADATDDGRSKRK